MNTYFNACDDLNPIRKRMHLDMGKALGAYRGGQHEKWEDLVALAATFRGRRRELLDTLGADSFPVRHPDEVSWDDMLERVRQLTATVDRVNEIYRDRFLNARHDSLQEFATGLAADLNTAGIDGPR